jgi:hypothetical protein
MFRFKLHGLNPTQEEISSAIKDFGYNMHGLFEVLQGRRAAVEMEIDTTLDTLSLADFLRMLVADVDGDIDNFRSSILIMSLCLQQPSSIDEAALESDTVSRTLAGTVVLRGLLQRYGVQFYQEVQLAASVFGRIPCAAAMVGRHWETMCHQEITRQPRFDLIPMHVQKGKLVDEDRLGELVGQSRPRSKCTYSWFDHVLRTYQRARDVLVWRMRMVKRTVPKAIKAACQAPRGR